MQGHANLPCYLFCIQVNRTTPVPFRPDFVTSSSLGMLTVEIQHTTKASTSAHRRGGRGHSLRRHEELISKSLMITSRVIVVEVFTCRAAYRCLPDENHSIQALLFHRPYEALGISVQIGRTRRQPNNICSVLEPQL